MLEAAFTITDLARLVLAHLPAGVLGIASLALALAAVR